MRSLVVLVLAGAALAGDFDLNARQLHELRQVGPLLDRRLDAAIAREIGECLRSFTPGELDRVPEAPAFAEMSPPRQRKLRQAIAAIRFAERHADDLADPWPAGLLLGSPEWNHWWGATRVLSKQPFGDGLERVAVALSRDPRPHVRLGAGRLAKLLAVFRGSNAACREIALRLLDDDVPNVAGHFAARDAHDFRDKEVTDRMVRLLDDRRAYEDLPGMGAAPTRVRDAVRARLAHEWRERGGWHVDGRRIAYGTWWRRHRDAYAYDPDPERWVLAADGGGTAALGGEIAVAGPLRTIHVAVLRHDEGWSEDRPAYDGLVRIRFEGSPAGTGGGGGPFGAELGWRDGGGGSFEGGAYRKEHHVAPDTRGGVRVRIRLWIGRVGVAPMR